MIKGACHLELEKCDTDKYKKCDADLINPVRAVSEDFYCESTYTTSDNQEFDMKTLFSITN